ncbi:uncharacterized protein BDR25DRAFT_264676 [Lindgomyces ingoldianus]|uniref:Uncharacterized protein n=1 Tax=Lindgomyces ingoldianus TaxID=673940 RepID=A0ACB6QPH6_9PLEO|nr:uncharacterized protein BDR25DRAFT_264676 [Lindgomyces ingoldianus]KAF2468780.1 hypothetical protein BDR25DRAFT_264676 [Lindgomyces ingoldianus]
MGQTTPKRVILRCREQFFKDQKIMVDAFFESQNLPNLEGHGVHICSEPSSTRLYLVLDLHCEEVPNVDLSELELQVFKVSRNTTFTFEDLGEGARKRAYQRSLKLDWGANQSNQTN